MEPVSPIKTSSPLNAHFKNAQSPKQVFASKPALQQMLLQKATEKQGQEGLSL
jgi:hypothetical protein